MKSSEYLKELITLENLCFELKHRYSEKAVFDYTVFSQIIEKVHFLQDNVPDNGDN